MDDACAGLSRSWRTQAIAGGSMIGLMMLLASASRSEPVTPPAYGASPLPAHVELRFCYYAGLAYSLGSVISVEAPIRREVVADRVRKILRCVSEPDSTGRHQWQEVDPDEGDPFRD